MQVLKGLSLSFLLGLCASAGALAQASVKGARAGAPKMVVGDTWQFKKTEFSQEKTTTSLQLQKIAAIEGETRSWMYLENMTNGFKSWWLFDSDKGAAIRTYFFDANSASFIGALRAEHNQDSRLQFPLQAGKKYHVTEPWDQNKGQTDFDFHVVGMEKVKTEAGEFSAWKILGKGKWVGGTNQATGETMAELWYSPEVKRFIKTKLVGTTGGKLLSTTTFELTEWSPGKN